VCLRKVEANAILQAIRQHGVDHYCGAPIVHNMLVNADPALHAQISHRVRGMVAGAAPPTAMIEGMAKMGFELTHTYGLTEVYGPVAIAARCEDWSRKSLSEQARLVGRQGVRYPLQEGMSVHEPQTMAPVPADGEVVGEIMFRGNIVMKGYLKNPEATARAFAGGWFHTGDLAVMEPDHYARIKDRSKDVIISGGENISSLEVEEAFYRHPAVMTCAVVARPDPKWGETPVAYVELKPGANATATELLAHCRGLLAGFKMPREVLFEEIPKTSTGKVQKFVLRERARSAGAVEGEENG
jgi:fatty-acyl-CoA synthase